MRELLDRVVDELFWENVEDVDEDNEDDDVEEEEIVEDEAVDDVLDEEVAEELDVGVEEEDLLVGVL